MNVLIKMIMVPAAALIFVLADISTAQAMSVEGNSRPIDGPVSFTQPETGVWYQAEGKWFFRTDAGEVRNRWICIEGADGSRDLFCFDNRGAMCTGWQKSSGGNWYYLRETADGRQGAMERGFVLDPSDGRCYYMDPGTGAMRTGWVFSEGSAYYFSEYSDGNIWSWDPAGAKWISSGSGRPFGSMYRNEHTPDGSFVDQLGRKVS